MFKGCFEYILAMFRYHLNYLSWGHVPFCSMFNHNVFILCSFYVHRIFNQCLEDVARMFKGCSRDFLNIFRPCFDIVLIVFSRGLVQFCSTFNMCSFCVHFWFMGCLADVWRTLQKCSRDDQGMFWIFFGHVLTSF